MADNIKVVIKVRPLIKRELDDNLRELWAVNGKSIYPIEHNRDGDNTFTFDHIFDCKSQTKHVYDIVARPIVEATVDGINGTIFAYGQTSSGKTYTMMGDQGSPGVIPLAVQNIFTKILSMTDRDFLLRVSYIEIYNEKIRDLLDINNTDLKIHEDFNGQLHVKAKEEVTSTAEEVLELMKKGNRNRAVGETQMNERSSRSHTIFYIIIESRKHVSLGSEDDDSVNVSQLNLVDLAGSERAGQTGATKQRLREGGHINKSLSFLGLVIRQLSDPNRGPNTFINFRDSKLTHFLRNSLGGNSKTGIICAVTPAVFDETLSTLMFAMSAKVIENIPKVNAVISDATLIKKLTKDMAKLQEELEDKRLLEDDNKKLQEQLEKLQHMILMGRPEEGGNNAQKAAALRRRTWCAPRSNLPPILEHNAVQTLFKDSLNYTENMTNISNMSNVTHRHNSKISAFSDRVPNTPLVKMQASIDVIELDDTPDASPRTVLQNVGSITPPTCSPNHKCFNVQQTPPCVLKYRAQHAEKEFKELQEMTSLEKMYAPQVVELIHDITALRQENEKCTFQIETQSNLITSGQEEIQELKNNLESLSEEKSNILKHQTKLEEEIEKYKNINTDLQFEMENLTQRSQNREKELIASLKEARESNAKCHSTSRTSLIPQFLNMSRDLSLANSDLDTTNEEVDISEKVKLISKLQDDLKSVTKEINLLKDDLEAKVIQIKELEDQIDNKSRENSQLKINVTELTKGENDNPLDSDECKVLKMRISELEELIKKKDASNNTNIEFAKTDIEALTQLVEEMKTKNSELTNEISKCHQQLEEHLSKIKNQDKELELAKDTITQLNNIIEMQKDSLLSIEENIKSKDTPIISPEESNELRSTLESKELHFDSEMKTKLNEINNLSLTINNLNKKICDLSEEHSMTITSKESIISELKSQIINKDNELSIYIVNCQQMESEMSALKIIIQQVDDLQSKLSAKTDINQNLTQQNIELDNKYQSVLSELCNANEKIEIMSHDIINKDLVIKSLTDENNNMNELIQHKDSELRESETNVSKVTQDLQAVCKEKELVEEQHQNVKEMFEKIKAENLECMSEMNRLKNEIESKCKENSELNDSLLCMKTEITHYIEDITEKTTCIDSLHLKILTLSQQLSESANELASSNSLIQELKVEKYSLQDNIKSILHDITTLNNSLINSNQTITFAHTPKFHTDYGELNTLELGIRKLISENGSLKNESLLFENKENVSFRMDKTPLKNKNQSNSCTGSLDSIKSLKSPKCPSAQNTNRGDCVKDILDMIDCGLENLDNTNLTNPSPVCTAELALILNKIKKLQTSLQDSDSNNSELKQKIVTQENELYKVKESLSFIGNCIREIQTTISADAMYSNLYNTIKDQIQNIQLSISQLLDSENTSICSSVCRQFISNQDDVENASNLKTKSTKLTVDLDDIKRFTDSLEKNVLAMNAKFNISLEDTESDTKALSVSQPEWELTTRLTTLSSLYNNFCNKIENIIYQQNQQIASLNSKYKTLQNDMIKSETELHTLCKESEELYKKIISARNESMVADAETTLKSFILCTTEHHHNNLHSTCMNALSFIKEHLFVLQKFLENPDLTQRDIVDIYCNITTPGLEIVETPIKDCTSKIVETRMPRIPFALFPTQENVQKNVDRSICTEMAVESEHLKSDYESKCLENQRLNDKLKIYEPLVKQYDDLVLERDSLSTQLMDTLEDIDNLKSQCADLTTKLSSCICKSPRETSDNVNVSIQTHTTDCDMNVVATIDSNMSACYDYIVEKIILIKKDFIPPSNNLKDLLSRYTEELNYRFNALQDEINTLKDKTLSLESKLYSKSSRILELEEKITCHNTIVSELQNSLFSKDNDIKELVNQVNLNENKVVELTVQLEEKIKSYNENKMALLEKESCIDDLKKEICEKDINCSENIKTHESEKTHLINQVNELETKLNEVKECEVRALQLNEEYSRKIADLESQVEQVYSEKVNIHERDSVEKDELQTKLLLLTNKIKELENINVQSKDDSSQLKHNIDKLIEEKTLLKTCLNEKDEYCKALQQQVESKINEMKDLENIKINIESQLTTYSEEKSNLLHKIEQLESKLMLSEKNVSDLRVETQNLKEKNGLLSNSYSELKEREVILSSSLKELTSAHEALTTDLESNRIQLSSLGPKLEHLQNIISEKNLLIENITAELKEKSNYLAAMKDENFRYVSERKVIEEEKLSLLSNNESLIQMLSEKDSEISEKVQEISKLKSNHRNTVSLQFENDKLKHEVVKKNETIGNLEEQLVGVNNKLNGVTSQLVEMSSLKSINSILEARVSDLQSELSCLLRSSPKLRNNHLQFKRQSLHDLHRNLSSSNENCNDISMEDCTMNTRVEKEDKYKMLEEKCNNLNSLYSDTLDTLNRKTEEHNTIVHTLTELKAKYEACMVSLQSSVTSKVDASTNTSNNRPEDNAALMDMFVDKLTHNHLKEKYMNLSKANEELRNKHKEQAVELRRLQHSLQNNTLHKLLPHDEEKQIDKLNSKLQQYETDTKSLMEQLNCTRKEHEELKEKYNEMDKEYDACIGLYRDNIKSYNELSNEKFLLEAKIKNMEEELGDLRRGSPGRDSRRKRQSMHDFNRGLSVTTKEETTTSPDNNRLPTTSTVQVCTECETNRLNLDQLEIKHKELLTKVNNMQPQIFIPSSSGSGIVQSQQLSDCLMENKALKVKLAKYKEYIMKNKMNQQRQQPM